jgi:hypothetical protein
MARTNHYTNEEIISALKKFKGAVYLAADDIGCDPDTIYRRAKTTPSIKKAITKHRGKMLDTAELALYNAIMKGESWAIAFALKSVGRKRGYGDRVDHMHGIDPKQLAELKRLSDSRGVPLSDVFAAMMQELANVDSEGNSES